MGQRGNSFFLLFLPPGTTTPPSLEACARGSLPISAPLPRNGGGAGPGQAD